MTRDTLCKVIATAEGELGDHEENGQNDGSCLKYQEATGNGPGDSWCLSFIVWCLLQVLGKCPIKRTGSTESLREWAHAHGILLRSPKYGRIGLLINVHLDHAHHAFIVTSDPAPDGSFDTIEGNSNDNGSPNGTGVYKHHRGGPDDPLHYEFVDLAAL